VIESDCSKNFIEYLSQYYTPADNNYIKEHAVATKLNGIGESFLKIFSDPYMKASYFIPQLDSNELGFSNTNLFSW
jgi:hypothetical protein